MTLKDSKIKAAGIMYVAGDSVLLLKRNRSGDKAATWAFPGGKIEDGETSEQAAIRESKEEISYSPGATLSQLDHSKNDDVEFTTFLSRGDVFHPTLNAEHTGYVWAPLDALPTPLHPGVQMTLDKYKTVGSAMDSDRIDSQRTTDINDFVEIKNNPLSKVGIFNYTGASIGAPDKGKMYKVYRPAVELSDPETINSFKLIPWTDNHPSSLLGPSEKGYTAPEEKGIEGVVGEDVYFDNDTLYGNIKIFSDRLKRLIEDGKEELSCGYKCIYKFVSGMYNGEYYDAIQTKIRGNHLALVNDGRMGSEVAVMDSYTFTIDSKELIMTDKKDAVDNKATDAKDAAPTMDALAKGLKDVTDAVAKLTQDKTAKDAKDAADAACAKDAKAKDDSTEQDDPDMEGEDKKAKDAKGAKDSKASGMDAKEVEAVVSKSMESFKKSFLAETSQKNEVVGKLTPFIGTFDHKEKTLSEIEEYGVKKLGITCEKGQEGAVLNGFFHAQAKLGGGGAAFALDAAADKGEVKNDFIKRHNA